MAAGEQWIWITRWEEFQHYTPERDRAPAWIKTYTRQLDDDRYLDLSAYARAVLHDLRMMFARSLGKLTTDTRQLSGRAGYKITTPALESLVHAGLIEVCSREVLEERLDQLYSRSSPRARPRAREEVEEEVEGPLTPAEAGDDSRTPTTDNGSDALGGLATPCLICGTPVLPGYRCPGCNSNPRAAGSSLRQTATRRTTGSQFDRAEAYTRNEGWQYDFDTYRSDLGRFTLTPDELRTLDALRAALVDEEDARAW